jgi:hypothetical protein
MIARVTPGTAFDPMADSRLIDELKQLGAEVPAPEPVVQLYRRAFAEFGALALWSSRPVERPTVAHALSITEPLRVEGNLASRRLAEQIEPACRAVV